MCTHTYAHSHRTAIAKSQRLNPRSASAEPMLETSFLRSFDGMYALLMESSAFLTNSKSLLIECKALCAKPMLETSFLSCLGKI